MADRAIFHGARDNREGGYVLVRKYGKNVLVDVSSGVVPGEKREPSISGTALPMSEARRLRDALNQMLESGE